MLRQDCKRLSIALPGLDAASGKPPAEFLLFGVGVMSTSKGDFLIDEESIDLCMAAYADQGNRLTIDYEHQALSNPPVQAPAAASFVPQRRDGGIWATDVRWTPKATEYLTNKEYLFFSPAFLTDKENRPTHILNIALTNIPATKNMQPLVAANQATEVSMKTVLSALSLRDNASEAEALSAVNKMSGERTQLLIITGKDSVAEALGTLDSWKQSAAEVVSLREAATKAKADLEESAFASEIAAAKTAHVLAPSDDHERNQVALSYKGRPDAIKLLRGFLSTHKPLVPGAALPRANAAAGEPAVGTSATVSLTGAEKDIARKMGVPEDALLKNKIRHLTAAKNNPVVVAEDDEDAA